MSLPLVAFDSETHPLGPDAVAPRMVCASWAWMDGEHVATDLRAHPDGLRERIEAMLTAAVEGRIRIVTHQGAFDYASVCATWPELLPLVFRALHSGNCTDTLWSEKLLNLSTTGRLDYVDLPDGTRMEVKYNLSVLELAYLGRDRSAEKEGDDVWRVNYYALDGLPAAEYPPEAAKYAREDAEGTLLVHRGQLGRAASTGASLATAEFQLLSSFCLYLETAWGMATNPEEIAKMRADVERVLAAHRDLLVASKVLRQGRGAVPYVKQLDKARDVIYAELTPAERLAVLEDPDYGFDWTPHVARLRELGIKFRAAEEESVDQERLQAVAADACRRAGIVPDLTDGRVVDGVRHRQIKLGDEETETLAAHCPIMAQYHVRKSLRKLVTNQIPILEQAPVVHFKYDALKETTRTSSSGNAKGKPALYPAANGQQVPKAIEGGDLRVDPRRGYRPRPGTVFFDVDLHCLELACVGQITHDLFGTSVHLDRYNAGYDLHAYLASQILVRSALDPSPARDIQDALTGGFSTPEEQYQSFLAFKKCGVPELEAAFKKYRNLAKPIGLGFPGGIGPAKMTLLARVAYAVTMTEPEAQALREMWRDVYPEMPRYFEWLEGQVDQANSGQQRDADGRPITMYRYVTPMGAVRVGCTFCSMANGKAMQSPGAEAAKAGNNEVVQACYDPTSGSVLLGARPIAFVHDQVIGETTHDAAIWHEQAEEVSRLMIHAAAMVLPKVRMRTEALLTTVWSKSAEPTFGPDGRLIPWQPKQEK